jgi:hypothetical protein
MTTLPTLDSVANDMKAWRQTRLKRGPIPHELQLKIATLPTRYTLTEITKSLGMNTVQIRSCSNFKKDKSKSPVGFIRLDPPIVSNKVTCCLKRPDGATLECTIELTHFNQLMRSFLC